MMDEDRIKIKKDLLSTLMKEMSDIDVARLNPVETKEEMIEAAPEQNVADEINNDKADLAKAISEDDEKKEMPMVKERPKKDRGKSIGMQGKSLRDQLMAFKK